MDVAMLRSTAKFLVAEAGVLALPPTFYKNHLLSFNSSHLLRSCSFFTRLSFVPQHESITRQIEEVYMPEIDNGFYSYVGPEGH